MALLIYSNGIVEEMVPTEDTFSDRELVKTFNNYTFLETFRLSNVPNTWCLWGEVDNPPENEYNKIASEILETDVFSHLIFIHDSELNREWNMTDDILQKSYKQWMEELASYTNNVIENISRERRLEMSSNEKTSMIFLNTLGHTADKRVLFSFDPASQAEDFYEYGWESFAGRIYEYLEENFYKEPIQESKPFVIFADTKTIVIVENENFDEFIKQLSGYYEKNEKYEICKKISDIRNTWDGYLKIPDDIKTDILDSSTGPTGKKRKPKNKAD